jgi:hypothetical protein
VNEEGGDGEGTDSETSSLLSYRYVSLTELVNVCQVGFRTPIHLCTCVSKEGGNGKGEDSEASSLLSYTLRYVSLTELGNVCQVSYWCKRPKVRLYTYRSLLFIINR